MDSFEQLTQVELRKATPRFYLLFAIGSALVAACNVIWYRAKFAVRRKGFKVGFVHGHHWDCPNLRRAIAIERDASERARLQAMGNSKGGLNTKLAAAVDAFVPLLRGRWCFRQSTWPGHLMCVSMLVCLCGQAVAP